MLLEKERVRVYKVREKEVEDKRTAVEKMVFLMEERAREVCYVHIYPKP